MAELEEAELEERELHEKMERTKQMAKLDGEMEPKRKKTYVAPRLAVAGDIASLTEAKKPNQNSILGPLVGGNPGNNGNNVTYS